MENKNKNNFIVVVFDSIALDYPSNMPLPRIGESVVMHDLNGFRYMGTILDIIHTVSKEYTEIRIFVTPS